MKKEIIVFASSVMRGGRCVAGKEIESKQWIRPVSRKGGGALNKTQCTVSGGKDPVRPLQKIEIDVGSYCPLVNQPENWLIGKEGWNYIGEITSEEIGPYLDSPDSLWGTGNEVPYSEIASGNMTIEQSLYLVKISELQLDRPDIDLKKTKASFYYKGKQYKLGFTDPDFEDHRNWPHYQEEGMLCVSLAGKYPLTGCCHKIAAALI